jgi:hypothetical protein
MAVQVPHAMVGRGSCKPLDKNRVGRHIRDSLSLTQHLGCADCLFYQERALAHIVATVFDTEGFAADRKLFLATKQTYYILNRKARPFVTPRKDY